MVCQAFALRLAGKPPGVFTELKLGSHTNLIWQKEIKCF